MEKVDSRDSARGRRRPTTSGRQTRRFLAGLLAVAVGSSVLAVTSSVSANVPTPSAVPGATVPHGLAWFTSLPGDQPFFFGNLGDVPLYADMDGDGREDPVVFRPSTGTWYWGPDAAGNATRSAVFGGPGDSPLLGDIDADGRANLVIYRSSTQQFIYGSQTGVEITRFLFGSPGDLPVMGTWIDGRTSEPGLLRPSSRVWYLGRTAAGGAKIVSPAWGNAGDIPLSAKWHGAGSIYPALYRAGTQEFFIGGGTPWQTQSAVRFGNPGDTPVFGDVNGDGYAETVVVRPAPLGNSFRVDSVATSWDQAGTMPASLASNPLPLGVTAWVTVKVTNTGALPWRRTDVELRTAGPIDRGSGFATAQWVSSSRVGTPDESVIVSGGVATFRFPVSPQTSVPRGLYSEGFTLHHLPTGTEMTRSAGQPISIAVGSTAGSGIAIVDSIAREADGRIRIRGWAWSSTGQPATIKVSVDNVVIPQSFLLGAARPDVAPLRYVSPDPGFDFYLPSSVNGLINVAAVVDASQSIADVPAYNSGATIAPWSPPTTTTPTTTTPAPTTVPGRKPANTRAPTISGATVVGGVLTANPGSWSGAPTNYWLVWQKCDSKGVACVAQGATNHAWGTTATRTLTAGDQGATFRVQIEAVNDAGQSPSVRSLPTKAVIRLRGDLNGDGAVRVAVIGDSYISGEGIRSYTPFSNSSANTCHRSESAWPVRVARQTYGVTGRMLEPRDLGSDSGGSAVVHLACSGARIRDMEFAQERSGGSLQIEVPGQSNDTGQLDFLRIMNAKKPVDVVFISLSGNDVGFSDIAKSCFMNSAWGSLAPGQTQCHEGAVPVRARDNIATAGAGLTEVLRAIRQATPGARILLAGYPSAMVNADNSSGVSCNRGAFFTARTGWGPARSFIKTIDGDEQLFLNREVIGGIQRMQIDAVNRAVAEGINVGYLNWFLLFAGKSLCSSPGAINALSGDWFNKPDSEALHPNRWGHELMAIDAARWAP